MSDLDSEPRCVCGCYRLEHNRWWSAPDKGIGWKTFGWACGKCLCEDFDPDPEVDLASP